MLSRFAEQRRLHFQSTVRRAAPCTTSRCPPLRTPSPCSSTHPCTPARTLGLSGGEQIFAHRLYLELPLVFRAQVGSEATDRIRLVDNATYVHKILHAGAYFAALGVLSVTPARALVRFGSLGGWLGGMLCGLSQLPMWWTTTP